MLFSNTAVIDSLKNQLNIVEGKEKVEVLNELAKAYFYESPQKTIEYGNQALNLSQKLDYVEGEAQALKIIGGGYYYLSNYEKALECYQNSIEILEEIGDEQKNASTYNSIGIIYDELADFNKALKYYLMSLKINEKIGYKKGIAISLNNIGLIYWNLSNYDKTLEYYQKSLKIFEELENKRHIAHLLNNIGIVYKSLNDQDKALDYYLRSLKIKEQLGDKKGIANSLGNIGIIYKNLKNYDESLKYYLKALEMTEEIDDKWGTANTLNNIGNLYVKQQKYDKAFLYLEKGLKLAKEIKAKSNINNSYFFFSELFSDKKDYKKALEYFKLYSAVKDSIFNEESSVKIAETQTKYETEKKEKENELLKKDLEISSLQKLRLLLLLLGSILILAVVMIFFILRVRVNHRLRIINKDLAISKENTEQIRKQLALINTMLRHDLANNFIVIKTALQLYNEEKDEKLLKEADIKCDNGLELINSMRELEFSSRAETSLKSIDLRHVVDKLSKEFSGMNIQLNGNCKVRADEAFESVIHNIIENAKLHGKAKNITITFEEFSYFTEIKIHNDGTEIPADIHERIFEKQFSHGEAGHTGIGLFLVIQNINRYGGSIYVEDTDKPGVTFVINLKKA